MLWKLFNHCLAFWDTFISVSDCVYVSLPTCPYLDITVSSFLWVWLSCPRIEFILACLQSFILRLKVLLSSISFSVIPISFKSSAYSSCHLGLSLSFESCVGRLFVSLFLFKWSVWSKKVTSIADNTPCFPALLYTSLLFLSFHALSATVGLKIFLPILHSSFSSSRFQKLRYKFSVSYA